MTTLFVAFAIEGCAFFPVGGPSPGTIPAGATSTTNFASDYRYELVYLTPEAADLADAVGYVALSDAFTDRRPSANIVVGVGDLIGTTIYESKPGGLFIPAEAGVRAGNFITLPNQTVDKRGYISIPYAGGIKAAGRRPIDIESNIVSILKSEAIQPQVVISIVEQRSQLVSVVGEVNVPARLPIATTGERLLDSIARAGGIRGLGSDLWVRLIRGGKQRSIYFPQLTTDPRNNIYTWPNDTIYVYRDPVRFVAFGASGLPGQYNFEVEKLSFAEAVAKAGGLLDGQADPGEVYLYRKEPRDIASKLGIDISKYTTTEIPVVYTVNLRDPKGYFTATKLTMRNKDVIYVTNAAAVETAKVIQFLRLSVGMTRETNAAAIETAIVR